MRAAVNSGSVALTAGLLLVLAEFTTSTVSTKKDCPKGQVSTFTTAHKTTKHTRAHVTQFQILTKFMIKLS